MKETSVLFTIIFLAAAVVFFYMTNGQCGQTYHHSSSSVSKGGGVTHAPPSSHGVMHAPSGRPVQPGVHNHQSGLPKSSVGQGHNSKGQHFSYVDRQGHYRGFSRHHHQFVRSHCRNDFYQRHCHTYYTPLSYEGFTFIYYPNSWFLYYDPELDMWLWGHPTDMPVAEFEELADNFEGGADLYTDSPPADWVPAYPDPFPPHKGD